YLIRHGESTWNAQGRVQGWGDARLSAKGVAQAQAVARRLRRVPLQRLYTSPLARAAQTAAAIGARAHLPIHPVADFREVGLGVWEGVPVKRLRTRYPALYRKWLTAPSKTRIPDGEGIPAFQRRVLAAFRGVLEETLSGGSVAIVTHGGVIRAILAHVLGIPFDPLMRGISLGNTSITRLAHTRHRLAITMLNDTSHLNGHA
ncbi:MAG: hypothetical protein A3C53_01505, partial [Omnitrophica WOR_2 bacterium RIFCSPHIGHO2_02_FULL_68_15]